MLQAGVERLLLIIDRHLKNAVVLRTLESIEKLLLDMFLGLLGIHSFQLPLDGERDFIGQDFSLFRWYPHLDKRVGKNRIHGWFSSVVE